MTRPFRYVGDLTDAEVDELLQRFADEVLAPLGVVGSSAGCYSLYTALEEEIEYARHVRRQRADRVDSGRK